MNIPDFEKLQLANAKNELGQANNKINTYLLATTFSFSSFLTLFTFLIIFYNKWFHWIILPILILLFIYFIYLLIIIKPVKNIELKKKSKEDLDIWNFWTYSSVEIDEFISIVKKETNFENVDLLEQIYKNGILAKQRYESINMFKTILFNKM